LLPVKAGQVKKYLVPLSKQILVQENDYVKAGTALSDGAITLLIYLQSKDLLRFRNTLSMKYRKYTDYRV